MSISRFARPDGTLPPLAGADLSTDLSPETNDVQPDGQGVENVDTQSQVQPEGQGQGDAYAGLYDLSSVPDEYREHVERIAKDIDRNAQAKFQEAADFRKQWEPFQELGLHERGLESVQNLLALQDVLNDESTAQEAVLELAKRVGLEVEGFEDNEPVGDPDPIAEMRAEIDHLKGLETQREFQQATATELERLQSEWTEIVTEHGPFTDEQAELIQSLAGKFDSEAEPLKAAHALFNQIAGHAEQGLVKAKAGEPKAAEPAGRASTAVTPPETFAEAKAAHVARRSHLHAA